MLTIPNRAPIDYDEIRRPYNLARAIGAAAFSAGAIAWSLVAGSSVGFLLALVAAVISCDAFYRAFSTAPPFPGVLIDATVIGVAMVLRGPAAGIQGTAIMTILVTSALILTPRQGVGVVAYGIGWAGSVWILSEYTTLGFVGLVTTRTELLDALTSIALVAVTWWVLVLSVLRILAAQSRQAEALATERRAVQLKNEFVSMVSHELRTPLTGIAGFTDTLADTWTTLPSREVDEFLSIMGHETEHLANLVEDILVIPRLEAGQLRLDMEELDLAMEAHAVAEVVLPNLDYAVTIPSGVFIRADRTRLRQILRNLLENASKYGGDQVLIEGELGGPGVYAVSVSDNGSGVAPEDQERIFQHFEQLSTGDARLQQGVGLGLPIARKLARAMGGDLWYEDRFPVGAKFRFTIPIAAGVHGHRPTEDTHVHTQ